MLEMQTNSCREVWNWNWNEEMCLIGECLKDYRYIAIDTEYPGCLRETPRDASDEQRYEDMRFNVDETKLIQLGLTLFDANGRIGETWEINFADYGDLEDAKNEKSIEFLRRNGLPLEKIREEGIGIKDFFSDLVRILHQTRDVTWVTFHGSYDIAYLLKYLTGKSLPVTSERFSKVVARILDSVYDLKVMARRCAGLSSRVGLESLAREFQLHRAGTAHHAGSDSELTARVFSKMAQTCHNVQESEGFVYGLGYRIISDRLEQKLLMIHPSAQLDIHRVMMMRRCYGRPLPPPPPPLPLLRPGFVAGYPPFGGLVGSSPFGGFFVVPEGVHVLNV